MNERGSTVEIPMRSRIALAVGNQEPMSRKLVVARVCSMAAKILHSLHGAMAFIQMLWMLNLVVGISYGQGVIRRPRQNNVPQLLVERRKVVAPVKRRGQREAGDRDQIASPRARSTPSGSTHQTTMRTGLDSPSSLVTIM